MDTPFIDLQLLLDLSSPLAKQELLKLHAALTSSGCFQLVNHGVASSLMDQLHVIGKEFFSLLGEEKEKYSRTDDTGEGYGCDAISEDLPINWNDRLHLRIRPLEQRNLKLWPDIVPNFSPAESYSQVIILNLEENTFLSRFGEDGNVFARFNYYPPCPNPDQVVGLRPHSDATLVTILLQDKDVEGLQVCIDDQWYKVPIVPDALFINVGDQLEIMSNGILKSSVHKAVANKEAARMSVAVLCYRNYEEEIGPLSELIDTDRPKLYKTVDTYFPTFLRSYVKGERAIDAMKIPQ